MSRLCFTDLNHKPLVPPSSTFENHLANTPLTWTLSTCVTSLDHGRLAGHSFGVKTRSNYRGETVPYSCKQQDNSFVRKETTSEAASSVQAASEANDTLVLITALKERVGVLRTEVSQLETIVYLHRNTDIAIRDPECVAIIENNLRQDAWSELPELVQRLRRNLEQLEVCKM